MIRTLITGAILICATFFLPFWVQMVLYVAGLFIVSYKSILIIPAIIADAWYAPAHTSSFFANSTTLSVILMISVYYLIKRNTLIAQRYGVEKK